jgi:hypothetical protein
MSNRGDGYPSDWNSRRKEVYSRDNYECQNCGVKGGPVGDAELHAHHVVPISKGGVHDLSNLKTMCEVCHDAIHGSSDARSKDGHNKSRNSTASSAPDRIQKDEALANGNVPFADDAYRYGADRYPENNSESEEKSNADVAGVVKESSGDHNTTESKNKSDTNTTDVTRPWEADGDASKWYLDNQENLIQSLSTRQKYAYSLIIIALHIIAFFISYSLLN